MIIIIIIMHYLCFSFFVRIFFSFIHYYYYYFHLYYYCSSSSSYYYFGCSFQRAPQGKSSLALRFCQGRFNPYHEAGPILSYRIIICYINMTTTIITHSFDSISFFLFIQTMCACFIVLSLSVYTKLC